MNDMAHAPFAGSVGHRRDRSLEGWPDLIMRNATPRMSVALDTSPPRGKNGHADRARANFYDAFRTRVAESRGRPWRHSAARGARRGRLQSLRDRGVPAPARCGYVLFLLALAISRRCL